MGHPDFVSSFSSYPINELPLLLKAFSFSFASRHWFKAAQLDTEFVRLQGDLLQITVDFSYSVAVFVHRVHCASAEELIRDLAASLSHMTFPYDCLLRIFPSNQEYRSVLSLLFLGFPIAALIQPSPLTEISNPVCGIRKSIFLLTGDTFSTSEYFILIFVFQPLTTK